MLIAIVAITALCVIGIVALLYFKFRSGRADVPLGPEVVVAASSVPPSTTTASPTVVAPAATTSAASTAAAAATEAPSPTGSSAASASGSGAPAGTGAKKDSPGFLTLSCDPRCDQVSVGGKVFVPPIVHEPFPPGSYRANAKLGASSKVVSVIIVSGQNTPMKISMKH